MRYAGIGTREPTELQRKLCWTAGKYLSKIGWELHSSKKYYVLLKTQ
jgi:hypothetical protein